MSSLTIDPFVVGAAIEFKKGGAGTLSIEYLGIDT